jgi:hypothetical protein
MSNDVRFEPYVLGDPASIREALTKIQARASGGGGGNSASRPQASDGICLTMPCDFQDETTVRLLHDLFRVCADYYPPGSIELNIMNWRRTLPVSTLVPLLNQLVNNQLRVLSLGNSLVGEDLGPLAEALGHQQNLVSFGCSSRLEADPTPLVNVLAGLPNLKEILLGPYFFDHCSELSAREMAATLSEMDQMEEFGFHPNISPPASAFVEAFQPQFNLKKCAAAKHLHYAAQLIRNNISLELIRMLFIEELEETSFASLIAALTGNTHLLELDLFDHTPTKQELDVLLSLLKSHNFTLENLEFQKHTLDAESSKTLDEIKFLLRLNKHFDRKLLLAGSATPEDWANVIVRAKDEVSVVFYYLSKNPSLLLTAAATIPSSPQNASWQPASKRAKLRA